MVPIVGLDRIRNLISNATEETAGNEGMDILFQAANNNNKNIIAAVSSMISLFCSQKRFFVFLLSCSIYSVSKKVEKMTEQLEKLLVEVEALGK